MTNKNTISNDYSLDKLLQLQKIITYLKEHQTASRKDLANKIGLGTSLVEKLIAELKNLGYDIKNVGREKKYVLITDNQALKNELFKQINVIKGELKMYLEEKTDNFMDYLNGINNNKFIKLENNTAFTNFEHLGKMLEAIENKTTISFDYQKPTDEKPIPRVIKPYLIREYQNNWFVLGIELERNNQKPQKDETQWVKFYNFDRITNFMLGTPNKYKSYEDNTDFREKIQQPDYFENAYGLYINVHKFKYEQPKEIILSFSSKVGKGLKIKKFHNTQEIQKDNEQEFRISIKIYFDDDYPDDFLGVLATYGNNVKIISPNWLKLSLKNYYKLAFDQYK